jgi:protein-S-isoprenylcysteine O-methyltransferase Ste14
MLKFTSLALSTWGVIIIKMAFKNYRLREFLGFKDMPDQLNLAQSGILKYVRHPIYTGTILLFIGFWLFIPNVLNLVTVICTFLYLPIGIRLEEQKLEEEYGDLYRRYKDKVPALIPDLEYLFKSNQR